MAFIVLLAVPLIGYATYYWLNTVVDESLASYDITGREFCSPEFMDIWSAAGNSQYELNKACQPIKEIFLLGDASLWTGAASMTFLAVILGLSFFSGTNRSRLASTFSIMVPFSLAFVAVATIVQGGILTYSLYAIQVNLLEAWYPVVTLGVGFGALIVAFSVIGAAFSINRKVSISQLAIRAEETKYPEIWSFVREIANKVAAPMPKNIVVGLEPTFYATSATVRVLSDDDELTGETLYVSLPLMRLFSKDELGAVVGHELGHFKGDDVHYTMKFAPVYRALSSAVTDAARHNSLMAIPALSVLGFLLERFAKNERAISRQREFEADLVGSNATSSKALGAALLKVATFSDVWGDLVYDVIKNLEYGRPVSNMSKLYASRVAFDNDADVVESILQKKLNYKVSHPTDTHPTLSDRLANLDVDSADLKTVCMGLSDNNSFKLINDCEGLEVQLSLFQQKLYQASGLATFGVNQPDDFETLYGVARVTQAAAAKMVCADGEVQPSEIAKAEEKGKILISSFNSLEFRELCMSPKNLPSVEDLRMTIQTIFSDKNRALLLEVLNDIAKSDGDFSVEEKKLLDLLGEEKNFE